MAILQHLDFDQLTHLFKSGNAYESIEAGNELRNRHYIYNADLAMWLLPMEIREGRLEIVENAPSDPLPERTNREGEHEPLPIKNDLPCIQDLVMQEIEARKQLGVKRYGTVLQPKNGRSALWDLYFELMDALMYIRQKIWEEEH